ncbi:MAG: hypothetical protein JO202_02895 [Ktedonobacteraceae bacterium]|nr:hypothetical protein [Ktedonobacteraceae bacterium]
MRLNPPDGYGVVQVAPHEWCALEIERLTYADNPDEMVVCTVLCEQGKQAVFARRQEAVLLCHLDATLKEIEERVRWESLAAETVVYPDHCIHYVEEIVAITGHMPLLTVCGAVAVPPVVVGVMGYECVAGCAHTTRWVAGATQEEALAQAAEYVYADQFRCVCWQQWRHPCHEAEHAAVGMGG